VVNKTFHDEINSTTKSAQETENSQNNKYHERIHKHDISNLTSTYELIKNKNISKHESEIKHNKTEQEEINKNKTVFKNNIRGGKSDKRKEKEK